MSTAKYSGIAVAAANRAALARQEAEAERLRAPKPVAAKEEALLRHLRATMTASTLLGVDAREKKDETSTKAAPAAAPASGGARAASASSEPSSSGRTALRAREVTERARRETDASTTRAIEKRHMSKAERKRLKRARAASSRRRRRGTRARRRRRRRRRRVREDIQKEEKEEKNTSRARWTRVTARPRLL